MYAGTQLVGFVIGQHGSGIVAAGRYLADQRQILGVGVKRVSDQFVDHTGPVIFGGVDVIHSGVHGGT